MLSTATTKLISDCGVVQRTQKRIVSLRVSCLGLAILMCVGSREASPAVANCGAKAPVTGSSWPQEKPEPTSSTGVLRRNLGCLWEKLLAIRSLSYRPTSIVQRRATALPVARDRRASKWGNRLGCATFCVPAPTGVRRADRRFARRPGERRGLRHHYLP